MIKVKGTVRPRNLVIMAAVANVASIWNIEVTVTSGTDGRHMTGSKHYSGNALDVRSKTPFGSLGEKRLFLKTVLARLGAQYQGLLEGVATANEHFHVEYDPS